MRVIIHDLNDNEVCKFKFSADDKIIFAKKCNKHCIGCFSCWIKTPSKCILKDEFSDIVHYLKEADELIIISECRYGCYSGEVKRVLERCLGYVLPYFTIRNNEIHHQSRYNKELKLSTYFYGDISKEEQELLNQLVIANSINLETVGNKVTCVKNIKELVKCIH